MKSVSRQHFTTQRQISSASDTQTLPDRLRRKMEVYNANGWGTVRVALGSGAPRRGPRAGGDSRGPSEVANLTEFDGI